MDEVLARASLFDGLDPAEVEDLTKSLAPVERFWRNTVIFHEGEPGDRLLVVQSGKVKLGRYRTDHHATLLSILGPSDVFGELALLDGGPRTSTAVCLTEVRAYSVDRATLREWIVRRPEIAERLLQLVAERVRKVENLLMGVVVSDVPGRVAAALVDLAVRFATREAGSLRLTSDLTQGELAQLVGCSRETVNKVIAQFIARGWLRLEGKDVVILEPDRLARRGRT